MKRLIAVFILVLSITEGSSILPQQVIICGVCRNVETRLPHTISIIESIGALFHDYRVIVYENNSVDKTKNILKKWAKKNSRVFAISEQLTEAALKKQIVNRKENNQFFHVEEIARARNEVLSVLSSNEYNEFPYVIWIDMDFKIPPALNGFIDTFSSDREWDAVFAYGIDPPGTFWDWYAFRDANYPIGSELLGNYWWYMAKSCLLTPQDDWYPVYSAFGGCGIYKKASIAGCRYSGLVTADLEHVAKQLIQEQPDNPSILKYLDDRLHLNQIVAIEKQDPNLPKRTDPSTGFILHGSSDPLVWKMSSFVYQYPSVCEHVPFHASMILNGHGKLFINPKLVFTYGG